MKKDLVEIFIVVSAWSVYLYLVITKVANVEGFIALTVYIVKKALDLRESNQPKQEERRNEEIKLSSIVPNAGPSSIG